MNQHPIDLLPEAIRARSQAGVRMGRYVAGGLIALVVLVATATHARFTLDRAQKGYEVAREQADLVLETEAKATELRDEIRHVKDSIVRYNQVALPLNTSTAIATMIAQLPEGVALDRVDVSMSANRVVRSARSTGNERVNEDVQRMLYAEITGTAPDDRAIAEFVSALESTKPLRQVSLDFSRTRLVRTLPAREFRLSFRIDMDVPYVINVPQEQDELVMETPHDE